MRRMGDDISHERRMDGLSMTRKDRGDLAERPC
jgi:hypothetical protein